ncbi:hypothetical protein [Nocardia wallacei]|uniref:hypothetical protein n=1 Tax=Nocardia wallacei TaxID=480035 RepID=UPI002455A4F8|nr:hypothetical protein [Nocardia wallacei]
MTHYRRWRGSILGLCVLALTATGCIGAVDRADFEELVQGRGGGLVSALPGGAITALQRRLGTADLEASVILLTAPNSSQFQFIMLDQPPQVTAALNSGGALSGRYPLARLRIRVPQRPDELDDYTFALDTLSEPAPVQALSGDLNGTTFAIGEVPALQRVEEIVDTSIAHSGLDDAHVSALLVHRSGQNVLVTVNVVAPRGVTVLQFDRAGTLLRTQRA